MVDRPDSNSIALGLSAPFTGTVAYAHLSKFGAGHFIVNEEQIRRATQTYYDHGFVVEPAGAAGLAAIMDGQVWQIVDILL